MLNSGAISQINAQGTNQRSLQDLMNQYSGELATGTYNGQQTMEGANFNQQFDLNKLLNPLIVDSQRISNNDATSQINERNIGQLIALASATKNEGLMVRLANAGTGTRIEGLFSGAFDNSGINKNTPAPYQNNFIDRSAVPSGFTPNPNGTSATGPNGELAFFVGGEWEVMG